MHPQTISFRTIINRWSKRGELARALGIKPGVVRLWRHRDSIPRDYWVAVTRAARSAGFRDITLTLLARAAVGESPPTETPPHGTET